MQTRAFAWAICLRHDPLAAVPMECLVPSRSSLASLPSVCLPALHKKAPASPCANELAQPSTSPSVHQSSIRYPASSIENPVSRIQPTCTKQKPLPSATLPWLGATMSRLSAMISAFSTKISRFAAITPRPTGMPSPPSGTRSMSPVMTWLFSFSLSFFSA